MKHHTLCAYIYTYTRVRIDLHTHMDTNRTKHHSRRWYARTLLSEESNIPTQGFLPVGHELDLRWAVSSSFGPGVAAAVGLAFLPWLLLAAPPRWLPSWVNNPISKPTWVSAPEWLGRDVRVSEQGQISLLKNLSKEEMVSVCWVPDLAEQVTGVMLGHNQRTYKHLQPGNFHFSVLQQ